MERKIEVKHISVHVKGDFEKFTKKIEQLLGRFDRAIYQELQNNPQIAEKTLKKMEGEEGLMLFDIQDHGKLLNILGSPKKAKLFVLGNPLIAIEMTRHDIRAGLYAPLRIFVYEKEGSLLIEYDLPSSLFGQFNNEKVLEVAKMLDRKLENLIQKAQA